MAHAVQPPPPAGDPCISLGVWVRLPRGDASHAPLSHPGRQEPGAP